MPQPAKGGKKGKGGGGAAADDGGGGGKGKGGKSDKLKTCTHVKARHLLCEKMGKATLAMEELGNMDNVTASKFGEVAQKYSECPSGKRGGDLGWFDRQKMHGDFTAAAFSTTPGSYTNLVKTSHGYHIIFVEGRK
eukprot:TRINITY_DN2503_c0_g1_i2.p1 TRINITY_DN2503_c0_g1~~TRINITY_DN2503_c0_g1_i2.p1  ORF type:complete len:150 (+),score=13.86 TRINITY_DN2503_c0_g1_i2:43-450(+)